MNNSATKEEKIEKRKKIKRRKNSEKEYALKR